MNCTGSDARIDIGLNATSVSQITVFLENVSDSVAAMSSKELCDYIQSRLSLVKGIKIVDCVGSGRLSLRIPGAGLSFIFSIHATHTLFSGVKGAIQRGGPSIE